MISKREENALNKLYFGDCLDVLRNEIADESVDLVYLDPPFNSSRNYNLLFKAPSGHQSEAQIAAFEDTWHWGEQAEREFREILSQPITQVAEIVMAYRRVLCENDLMAYIVMMANRLLEMRRVLSKSGSLYLHCDPTASHYLKAILDAVFGPQSFLNEIVWQRTAAKGDARRKFGAVHDTLLLYCKDANLTVFNPVYAEKGDEYLGRFSLDDGDGKGPYRLAPLDSPNPRPNLTYVYKGYSPPAKGWRVSLSVMEKLDQEGRLAFPRLKDGRIARKHYLLEQEGRKITDVWTDIAPLQAAALEKLGYPTQKPMQLLERVIQASTNESAVVLDPFCGCGTAVHAAEKLGRQWIGIDITHLAISLIEKRLRDAFPNVEFEVHGTPRDLEGARDLASRDKYQFQWWACSLVGAQPWQDKKKGADRGIDGIIYFQDEKGIPKKIIVSVKGGETVGRAMIADLKNSVEREKAQIGLFVTLTAPTREMTKEALTAGYYESPNFKSGEYPKIQILTIEGLLNGTQHPRYPDLSQGAITFRRASTELMIAEDQPHLFGKPNEEV